MVCSQREEQTNIIMDNINLKMCSYNSTGLGSDKVDYIRTLLSKNVIDFMLLQETWLLPNSLEKLGSINKDYVFYGVSGICHSQLLTGRPYGGTAILWHKKFNNGVKRIDSINCNRLSAVRLDVMDCNILLINCYMPCDNWNKTHVDERFCDVLDEIESLIAKYPADRVIIGGDLNIDLSRGNAHDTYYSHFIERCNLVDVSLLNGYNIDYTYCDLHLGSYSTIDHFAMSLDLCVFVNSVIVSHDPLNPSKHSPITLDIAVKLPMTKEREQSNCDKRDRIQWHKAGQHVPSYQHNMDTLLSPLCIKDIDHCIDTMCNDPDHLSEIDLLCNELIECAMKADSVFPRVRSGRKVLAGWNNFVKPFQDDCKWWYSVWCEQGKPKSGIVFDHMKEAKKQYSYAVRRLKRRQKEIKNQKFIDALIDNNARDFFKEVKKINPKPTNLCGVDGKQSHVDIANVFREKYEELYNSVPSDTSAMGSIKDQICTQLQNKRDHDFCITIDEIVKAVNTLKHEKTDGDKGFMSNHLLYASNVYFKYLAKLLSSMYIHGYYPKPLLNASIVSIPKDCNKSLSCGSNYRGIALCNAISKVADLIFLERNSQSLRTSDMQFAFKRGMGTTLCSLVLKEVIQYYMSMKTPVYACFLDASKAFDRVRYDKLFSTLIKKGVDPLDLRLLFNQYERQCIRTTWKGSSSCYFNTTNGIRQGSIASPTLFCVYLDDLLCKLQDNGSGCWIGDYYYGVLAYADDVTIVSPSIKGLKDMLKVCETFCKEYDLQFNPTKSVCVPFNRSSKISNMPTITLCDTVLKWEDKVKHLGNYIMYNLSEASEINVKKGDLVGRVNVAIVNLSGMSDEVLMQVFNSKCCHYYGSAAWNLTDKHVSQFYAMYNKCVRRLLQLPYKTHTRYLTAFTQRKCIQDQIADRFIKLYVSMLQNVSPSVNFLVNFCIRNSESLIARNVSYLSETYSISKVKIVQSRLISKHLSTEDKCVIQAIRDIRANAVSCVDSNESHSILQNLCGN